MKKSILLVIILYSFNIHAQQLTVFYKEKRIPSQTSSQKTGYDQSDLKVYLLEMNRLKEVMRTFKNKDSIELYGNLVEEQLIKLANHYKRLEKEQNFSTIPEYEYITVLKIKDQESIYYPQEKVNNDTLSESMTNKEGHAVVNQRINYNDSEIIYIDQLQKKRITSLKKYSFDLRGREFLIEEDLNGYDWKLTKETKRIDQYLCYKAIFQYENIKIEAWYTNEIKANNGPKGYHGLPGLILELQEGKRKISFDRIDLLSTKNMDIKPPTEGTKITREELKDLPSKLFQEY